MELSKLKQNPNNPRVIKDANFQKLCKSIQEFPKMMALRPIVVDADNMVLGGNMRLKALQHLKFKQIPDEWVKNAADLTEDEQRRFIIADNVSGGEWDVEDLSANWDRQELDDWGLEIEWPMQMPADDELIGEEKNKPATMKITFPTPEDLQKCESEIQEVINRISPKAFYSVSAGEI